VVGPNRAALYNEKKGDCRWRHVLWDARDAGGVASVNPELGATRGGGIVQTVFVNPRHTV